MIFDGMTILRNALKELDQLEVQSIDCTDSSAWKYGTSLVNYIRQVWHCFLVIFFGCFLIKFCFYFCGQVSETGLTGYISFDESGFRSNLTFEIISTTENDFELIGMWINDHIEKTPNWIKHSISIDQLPMLRISTILSDPFLMIANSSKELKGNDRYEGYVVDLLKEITKLLNVRFVINLVKDGNHGSMVNSTTNEWNGLCAYKLFTIKFYLIPLFERYDWRGDTKRGRYCCG